MEWFFVSGWIFFGLMLASMLVNIFDSKQKASMVAISTLLSTGLMVWVVCAMNLVR